MLISNVYRPPRDRNEDTAGPLPTGPGKTPKTKRPQQGGGPSPKKPRKGGDPKTVAAAVKTLQAKADDRDGAGGGIPKIKANNIVFIDRKPSGTR